MHELSVANAIIKTLQVRLGQEKFIALRKIFLRIGSLSCVQEDALRFAFSVLREKEGMPEVSLEIERVDAKLKCKVCKTEFCPEDEFVRVCPECGAFDTELLSGDELNITAVELSSED